jgi:hypothetical protein
VPPLIGGAALIRDVRSRTRIYSACAPVTLAPGIALHNVSRKEHLVSVTGH